MDGGLRENSNMPAHQALVRKISRSKILSDYEIAFANASGLPIRFQPAGVLDATDVAKSGLAPHGSSQSAPLPLANHFAENPFCALISKTNEGCKMCLAIDEKLTASVGSQPRTEICIAGLADTAVPVTVKGRLAGFLRTGQVALERPVKRRFSKLARTLMDWGLNVDLKKVEEAWFHSKVLEPGQYEAFVELLKIFARHIGEAAEHTEDEPPKAAFLQKALHYIDTHQQEDLRIEGIAKALNLSVFYFCKVFRKATGKTFTQYLAEVRVAKAENLLLNPHVRISEVAFESGFQSITHFNRVFKKLTGKNPSDFRAERQAESGLLS